MTSQPFPTSALRGAVDLSPLRRPAGGPAGAPGAGVGPGGQPGQAAGGPGAGPGTATPDGASGTAVVMEGTDATFSAVVNLSMTVPVVVTLMSSRLPQSADFVDVLADIADRYDGRFQLVAVDVDANPGIQQAFRVQSVPMTLGLVQGQPVPLFAGVQPPDHVRAYMDELLKLALANGVTGRAETRGGSTPPADEADVSLPPLHQEAFDAIERGDLEAAAAAYEQALKANPADAEAKLGLAQVGLLQRTADADPAAARQVAADAPEDVVAQTLAADLDLLEGRVEEAFARLLDLVRVTAGSERNAAREHLLELFDLLGADDERVVAARRALMSALF